MSLVLLKTLLTKCYSTQLSIFICLDWVFFPFSSDAFNFITSATLSKERFVQLSLNKCCIATLFRDAVRLDWITLCIFYKSHSIVYFYLKGRTWYLRGYYISLSWCISSPSNTLPATHMFFPLSYFLFESQNFYDPF